MELSEKNKIRTHRWKYVQLYLKENQSINQTLFKRVTHNSKRANKLVVKLQVKVNYRNIIKKLIETYMEIAKMTCNYRI